MSQKIEILKKFKAQLIAFLNELIEMFPKDGDLVMYRIFIENNIPIETAMTKFIHKLESKDLKKHIENRSESFFMENNIIDIKHSDRVNYLRKIWRSGVLDDEDKDMMWKWVDHFVNISEEYKKVISENS